MTWTSSTLVCALLLVTGGCSAVSPKPQPEADCSVLTTYEFREISYFGGGDTGWFQFADATPGAIPDPKLATNLMVTTIDPPRCGDTTGVQLNAHGHNFYGTGYGNYSYNHDPAIGTGYEGISFWAHSAGNSDTTFMLYVDDGRTIILRPDAPDAGVLPPAGPMDKDNDGDGLLGPGDVAVGTSCLLPPPQTPSTPTPACYSGGVLPPGTPPRVPDVHECGNQFHTYVTVTENWQLFRIPWSQLRQWPCPNVLGGIDPKDIREIEIKFIQGSSYDIWFDDVAFYRLRADSGG